MQLVGLRPITQGDVMYIIFDYLRYTGWMLRMLMMHLWWM